MKQLRGNLPSLRSVPEQELFGAKVARNILDSYDTGNIVHTETDPTEADRNRQLQKAGEIKETQKACQIIATTGTNLDNQKSASL